MATTVDNVTRAQIEDLLHHAHPFERAICELALVHRHGGTYRHPDEIEGISDREREELLAMTPLDALDEVVEWIYFAPPLMPCDCEHCRSRPRAT